MKDGTMKRRQVKVKIIGMVREAEALYLKLRKQGRFDGFLGYRGIA
jgi:hypothetical protein